jgi:hypothetical protein
MPAFTPAFLAAGARLFKARKAAQDAMDMFDAPDDKNNAAAVLTDAQDKLGEAWASYDQQLALEMSSGRNRLTTASDPRWCNLKLNKVPAPVEVATPPASMEEKRPAQPAPVLVEEKKASVVCPCNSPHCCHKPAPGVLSQDAKDARGLLQLGRAAYRRNRDLNAANEKTATDTEVNVRIAETNHMKSLELVRVVEANLSAACTDRKHAQLEHDSAQIMLNQAQTNFAAARTKLNNAQVEENATQAQLERACDANEARLGELQFVNILLDAARAEWAVSRIDMQNSEIALGQLHKAYDAAMDACYTAVEARDADHVEATDAEAAQLILSDSSMQPCARTDCDAFQRPHTCGQHGNVMQSVLLERAALAMKDLEFAQQLALQFARADGARAVQ